jgi:hypothetical protein
VPPPTYRIDPGALALALDIGGALLLAAALGFIWFEIASRRQPRRRDDAPVLARALALVRDAQTRAVEDRRRAVGLLARALPGDAERLSSDASRIAWSMPEPTPARLEELARDVEHGLEEQR